MTVQEAAANCGTASVHGLSQQIIQVFLELEPNALVPVEHALINAATPQSVNLLLQPPARTALINAVEERGKVLTVNSCLRTVAQQYILLQHATPPKRCGVKAAAKPGHSNHEGGVGIDIANAAVWKPVMAAHNWHKLGSFDPPHFDFVGQHVLGLESVGVKAFQILWNRHHPQDQIDEDGIYGNETEKRLVKSPAGGFS